MPRLSSTRRFYKENGLWYIDLPEFIEGGFGTKANLLMVDGSDQLLDILSGGKNEVTVTFGNYDFSVDRMKNTAVMRMKSEGLNQEILDAVGHAPIQYGRYYDVDYRYAHATTENNSTNTAGEMVAWLCPVAEWVFGEYPEKIYVQVA